MATEKLFYQCDLLISMKNMWPGWGSYSGLLNWSQFTNLRAFMGYPRFFSTTYIFFNSIFHLHVIFFWLRSSLLLTFNLAASSKFGTYRLCEQRRFRRACASAQSRQNLRCSLIQAVSQEEPSDRKPDPWPLWMAGHAQLKFVMTECSKTQIRLTGLNY